MVARAVTCRPGCICACGQSGCGCHENARAQQRRDDALYTAAVPAPDASERDYPPLTDDLPDPCPQCVTLRARGWSLSALADEHPDHPQEPTP